MTILVAEDDPASARIIEVTLKRCGYSVVMTPNGREALATLRQGSVDVVVTDWMMPELDGIEVVRSIRRLPKPHPVLIVLTALRSDEARDHALQSGADEFLSKPLRSNELLDRIHSGLARRQATVSTLLSKTIPVLGSVTTQSPGFAPPATLTRKPTPAAPFSAVGIAASTGGPLAIKAFLEACPLSRRAAYLIVLHGPDWVQRNMVTSLSSVTDLPVGIAVHGAPVEPGRVYLSPGDRHLCLAEKGFEIEIRDTPEINYVRPSADPLFQSLADRFGASAVGVVLTGLGIDGAQGARSITSAGGKVFAQDPTTAVAESMPRATITLLGAGCVVDPIPGIASAVSRIVESN